MKCIFLMSNIIIITIIKIIDDHYDDYHGDNY